MKYHDQNELTNADFWNENWDSGLRNQFMKPFSPYLFCRFHPLLKKHLPMNKNKKFIEIGCVPGKHLVYFNKVFDYQVEGIDFSDAITMSPELLKYHGLQNYKLHHEDFLKFDNNNKYDVVASFGFIEHFKNWKEIIIKHTKIVENEGYLIISAPNLLNTQYKLHKFLDPEFETEQVPESTDPKKISELVEKQGFEILYSGYYQTFQFFRHDRPNNKEDGFLKKIAIYTLQLIGAFFTRSKINIPNKEFSPQVICIAKRDQLQQSSL